MHTFSVSHLTKSFRNKPLLTDISLVCKTGQILGIFGRNGSGKSTLLKILFGIVQANTINAFIDGKAIDVRKTIQCKQIAYLPQESFLPRDIKVREVIPLYFTDGDEQNKIFYAPKVSSFANQRISTLFHGELRYLEILLISHLDHAFLLMDEPFSMIEPLYKDVIKDLLLGLKETKGIIITDHYYHDVLGITDENILIANGTTYKINNKADLMKYGYIPTT